MSRERAADFKKAKLKLGKGKQVAQNATDTSIASKGIALPSQSLSTAGSKGSEPTSRRNLTLTELLVQSRHYSTQVKKQALQEALELVHHHPGLVQKHLLALTTTLAHAVADPSAAVRTAVRTLVRLVAESLPRASFVQVCAPPIVLYTLAALSSLEDPIRIDALRLVDALLALIPDHLVHGHGEASTSLHTLDAPQHDNNDDAPGARILQALLSLLKVRTDNASTGGGGTMTSASAATISDLSPEARLAVLSTLETFLRCAAARRHSRSSSGGGAPAPEAEPPWYLAGAFSSTDAFLDFLAASDRRPCHGGGHSPLPYPGLEAVHENDRFAVGSLGLYTLSTVDSTTAARPSLLALLHPTLLSAFLDSAPTALNPTATVQNDSSGNNGGHLATVTAVVAVARQLFTLELAGAPSSRPGSNDTSARRMLLAFLTHASPYFPFGADALAVGAGTGTKRPSVALQAEEAKFLSLNLAFAELSSLLVLSSQSAAASRGEVDQVAQQEQRPKGKGKKRQAGDKVEAVVLDRVQEWVVQALRGELTTVSSPMGTTLSPSSFDSLTPTIWALLNQPDPDRSAEVFEAVVDYFVRQNTNASSSSGEGEGETRILGLGKRRAGEFIARCVLIHGSPSYTAPFDLSSLASQLPATLSPNAKETKRNALARWLVALPKYLWEVGNAAATDPSRESEMEPVLSVLLNLVQQGDKGLIPRRTLESLAPLLTPFFHLVHPKTRAALAGPFTRLGGTSPASRQALDLVWYLARSEVGSRPGNGSGSAAAETSPLQGLVAAVERACAVAPSGEAAQRWHGLPTIASC
ncbi:hypothetical protein JCM3774_006132 [Rhodotorula dairenensis]